MEKYNDKLNNFKERVSAAATKVPLQEVKTVASKQLNEVQLNVWMPKTMLHALKQKALDEEKSIKQLVQTAVENYLQSFQ